MIAFTKVTLENFETEVLQCDMPVVLIFSIDDCEPWMAMEPVWAKLAEEYKGQFAFKNYHVPIEEVLNETNPILKQYDVIGFPSTIVFRSGEEPKASLGHMDRDYFVSFLSTTG